MPLQERAPTGCRTFILALLLLVVHVDRLPAQGAPESIERISLAQGLSQSVVNVITRDRRGFMWFGTQAGLNRYDGYTFTVYRPVPNNPRSLSGIDVRCITEDRRGMFWIGTSLNGLNRFDPRHETFERFEYERGNPASLRSNNVGYVYEDSRGEIWVFTGAGGVDRYAGAARGFRHYVSRKDDRATPPSDHIISLHEDVSGTLWLGTAQGLCRYDRARDAFIRVSGDPDGRRGFGHPMIADIFESPSEPGVLWIAAGDLLSFSKGGGLSRFVVATGEVTRYRHDPRNPRSIGSDIINGMREDRAGVLWMASTRGLIRFDRHAGEFRTYLPYAKNPADPRNIVRLMEEDATGAIWLATAARDGLYRFSKSDAQFIHYAHDPADPRTVSSGNVTELLADSAGILWVGTDAAGLCKIDVYSGKFRLYRPDTRNPAGLSGSVIRSIASDRRGRLWVGGLQCLDVFNPSRTAVTRLAGRAAERAGLRTSNIWALLEDRDGVMWLGSAGDGLYRADPRARTFRCYRSDPADPRTLGGDFVRCLHEDRNGALWVGTEIGGLSMFDRTTESFIRYDPGRGDTTGDRSSAVRAILEDSSGVLWLGTFGGGLVRMNRGANGSAPRFRAYRHDPRDPRSISSNYLQALCLDREGILWIGTFGGGLNRFDPRRGVFERLGTDNSDLPDDVIYAILRDRRGHLWMSSNHGLARLNPATREVIVYTERDGLQSMEFNGQAAYVSPRGEMFFGGINGMNSFFPDSLRENPAVPPVAITEFRIFNRPVLPGAGSPLAQSILHTGEIRLAHWQNDLTFVFAALQFSRPDQQRYRYMLERYDRGWRDGGSLRQATYTNLDPGTYVFRVRAANADGIWNTAGASVRIVIRPPWWRTVWAYAAFALLAAAALVSVYRLQHARITRRERDSARVREAELRARVAEAQAEAARAESERTAQEFERARRLQLSLLPRDLPRMRNLEIAVHMQTATEVGGDYYDFLLDEHGSLTVAVGDATGHGLNAGTMVSIIKSLFISGASQMDLREFFASCTRTIRQLHLGNLYMALTLVRIDQNRLSASAAGMPPMYIYRAATGKVDCLRLTGMPLGAVDGFRYQDTTTDLGEGDTILLLSDGLPELFNGQREMFEYDHVGEVFATCGHLDAQGVVDTLVRAGESWRAGKPPNDDITFVVLRVLSTDGVSAAG